MKMIKKALSFVKAITLAGSGLFCGQRKNSV